MFEIFDKRLRKLRKEWDRLVWKHAGYEEEDYDTLLYFYHIHYTELCGTKLESDICTLLQDIGDSLGFLTESDPELYDNEVEYFEAKGKDVEDEFI